MGDWAWCRKGRKRPDSKAPLVLDRGVLQDEAFAGWREGVNCCRWSGCPPPCPHPVLRCSSNSSFLRTGPLLALDVGLQPLRTGFSSHCNDFKFLTSKKYLDAWLGGILPAWAGECCCLPGGPTWSPSTKTLRVMRTVNMPRLRKNKTKKKTKFKFSKISTISRWSKFSFAGQRAEMNIST